MDQFCEKLNNAIKDEQKAPADYEMLESLSQTKKEKSTFKKISNDEKGHFSKLLKIKKERCS